MSLDSTKCIFPSQKEMVVTISQFRTNHNLIWSLNIFQNAVGLFLDDNPAFNEWERCCSGDELAFLGYLVKWVDVESIFYY